MGILDNHPPAHKLLQFISLTPFVWPKVTKAAPIPGAPTYFTDGSNNGKAGITDPEEWETLVTPHTSAQRVELVQKLQYLFLKTFINIVSDSAYVVGMTKSIETAKIKHVNSDDLVLLFLQLQKTVCSHSFLYHTYSSSLPSPGASHPWQFSGWPSNDAHF